MSAFAFAVVLLAASGDSQVAFQDRSRLPSDNQATAAYLTLAAVPEAQQEALEMVLRVVVPSLSTKAYLGGQLPVRVPGTALLRLDLSGLGWDGTWGEVLAKHYVPAYRPDLQGVKDQYGRPAVPLVVRGDWVAAALTDAELTGDSQYRLLYGVAPKNLAEFQKAHTVNGESTLAFARIEGNSGVSVQRERVMQNLPVANRGYYWQTLDSRVVAGETDQLENITKKNIKHDASEAIAAIPKHYLGQSGSLQAYFLANGKGERQEKAPADVVMDETRTRGVEIRNTVSCIGCHSEGLRHPTLDKFRAYVESGARILIKDKATQQEVDRYFDSPIAKELQRANEDYASAVEMCAGITPQQFTALFRQVVQDYDKPVSPEQAARELYLEPEEWRLALGWYSLTGKLTGRLALMAQGQSISRDQWQSNFHLAQKVVQAWHSFAQH
jgi:hypothetical protein